MWHSIYELGPSHISTKDCEPWLWLVQLVYLDFVDVVIQWNLEKDATFGEGRNIWVRKREFEQNCNYSHHYQFELRTSSAFLIPRRTTSLSILVHKYEYGRPKKKLGRRNQDFIGKWSRVLMARSCKESCALEKPIVRKNWHRAAMCFLKDERRTVVERQSRQTYLFQSASKRHAKLQVEWHTAT